MLPRCLDTPAVHTVLAAAMRGEIVLMPASVERGMAAHLLATAIRQRGGKVIFMPGLDEVLTREPGES